MKRLFPWRVQREPILEAHLHPCGPWLKTRRNGLTTNKAYPHHHSNSIPWLLPQDIVPATPASKQEDVPLEATAPATGDASRATRGGDQADKNNMPPPEPPNLYWKYAGLHIGLVDGNAHCTTLCMNSFYYWPRMYRYFKPKADGSPKCSKEALDLYQSDEGRALVEPPKNNFPCTKTGFLTCFGVGACIYAIVRF